MTRFSLRILISLVGVMSSAAHRATVNAPAAIALAEKALVAKFGDRAVVGQRPFTARFNPGTEKQEAVWSVRGRDPQNPQQFGGVMRAIVRSEDGHVVIAWIEK